MPLTVTVGKGQGTVAAALLKHADPRRTAPLLQSDDPCSRHVHLMTG